MNYFNYHATAKRLIKEGKLVSFFYADSYNGISPALVLLFNDASHPIMPIRNYKWSEYQSLLDVEKEIDFSKD